MRVKRPWRLSGVLLFCALVLFLLAGMPFWLGGKLDASAPDVQILTVVSPHPQTVREAFGRAFEAYFLEKTGQKVSVQWRVIGGTNDIVRFLDAQYMAAFRYYWTERLGKEWTGQIAYGFCRDDPAASPQAREARNAFLNSDVSCGVDVFFGGGAYEHVRQAARGQLAALSVFKNHPDWFSSEIMPETFAGERLRDPKGYWAAAVLSTYGIVYNADRLAELKAEPPVSWADLADEKYFGALALADPTKSGSIAKCFEMIFQEQMRRADSPQEGWMRALKTVQLICANARYFTDSAGRPNFDVASGDCAAGMAIDFYGRAQAMEIAARNPKGAGRFSFVSPKDGAALTADPVAVLRGAPQMELAQAFAEFVLSQKGQRLWNAPGGGSERFLKRSLARYPVRRDAYGPGDSNPYLSVGDFSYHPEWTRPLFGALRATVRAVGIDCHPELREAVREILRARREGRERDAEAAMAQLQRLDEFAFDRLLERRFVFEDYGEKLRWMRESAQLLRGRYAEALRLAKGEK